MLGKHSYHRAMSPTVLSATTFSSSENLRCGHQHIPFLPTPFCSPLGTVARVGQQCAQGFQYSVSYYKGSLSERVVTRMSLKYEPTVAITSSGWIDPWGPGLCSVPYCLLCVFLVAINPENKH